MAKKNLKKIMICFISFLLIFALPTINSVFAENKSLEADTKNDAKVLEERNKSEYQYKDGKVLVKAVLSNAEAVPDDAKLIAKELKPSSAGYDAYINAMNKDAKAKGKYSKNNTLLYDISFVKNGTEIEPSKGTVRLSVQFLDKQLENNLGAKNSSQVKLIHLPLTESAKKAEKGLKSLSVRDIKVEKLKADVKLKGQEEISAETKSFSVYATTVPSGQLRTDFSTNHTFETDGGEYTIESVLKRYQVTATENVVLNNHCMGSLFVKGNLTGWGAGFSDGNQITDLASSYVKGSVAGFNGKCATRGNNNKEYPALYLGSSNQVQDTYQKWEQYIVNGKTAYNNVNTVGGQQHGNEVAITDNYVDWNRLDNALKAESVAISNSITNTPSQTGGTLTINAGDRITIPDISQYSVIDFVGLMTSSTNTVVNILNQGNVNLPTMHINGVQPQVSESGTGNAIVWNLSKATSVKIPNQNYAGHVIAPGEYKLREVSGSASYSFLQSEIIFVIDSKGNVTLTGAFAQENAWVKLLPANSIGISTLQVKNYKYINMPETGSNTFMMSKMTGICFLLIGIVVLLRERRRSSD